MALKKSKERILTHREYINPANHSLLCVKLSPRLNPFHQYVDIVAILMTGPPFHNSKGIPVYEMLQSAKRDGKLESKKIIESTSGNTGFCLAALAPFFGVEELVIVTKPSTPTSKVLPLQLLGATVVRDRAPIAYAKQAGRETGFTHLNQYGNPANPLAHEKYTGPEIWKNFGGNIRFLSAGLGTTGLAGGAGKYLKAQRSDITVIGPVLPKDDCISGVRNEEQLLEVEHPYAKYVDVKPEVSSKASFEAASKLMRLDSLIVGPTSGFAYQGLVQHLETLDLQELASGHTKKMRAAFVCNDLPFLYLDDFMQKCPEYFS